MNGLVFDSHLSSPSQYEPRNYSSDETFQANFIKCDLLRNTTNVCIIYSHQNETEELVSVQIDNPNRLLLWGGGGSSTECILSTTI